MHIASRDRVTPGTIVRAGERIGHPSCEGGFSTGTHLHIARKYNGEWIPADQGNIPFVMDGWTSIGSGYVYDGWLVNENLSVIADNGRSEENEIVR
jgi:murein DD-endopeptidase MepM/ murein hydrolase activator NlpD